MAIHPTVAAVTDRIVSRSEKTRRAYLARMEAARSEGPHRLGLSCGNLAHGMAACAEEEKQRLREGRRPNIAIISAYNDLLSAHRMFEKYPDIIRKAAAEAGAVAQFAAGVPAMCDGVTQGQPGMELSLFSRDVIAMSTAISLSHNLFDAVLCLGVCDKIVPGLLIGALAFGHLPTIFVPGGPMPSGLPNAEKARIRQSFARGLVDRDALLDAEAASYHAPGTCTFYGTANTNQMLLELMGLMVPGAAFVPPGTPLRAALTAHAARRIVALTNLGASYTPTCRILDARAIVNGMVGILATGGSTNLTIHLVAIARAGGLRISWDDFAELSQHVPLIARVYPNGAADVNGLHAAGGVPFVVRQLLDAGLLHDDVTTVAGKGLRRYTEAPALENGRLVWRQSNSHSGDQNVLRPAAKPFRSDGGLKLLVGNLGRAIMKTSALGDEQLHVEAPAMVFDSQDALLAAFDAGTMARDLVAVVRFQGPRANGMPELHKLSPALGVLQDKGFKVALVTDGRMSGASGKIPAAIHVTPEAQENDLLARIENGDLICVDGIAGTLDVRGDENQWQARTPALPERHAAFFGMGRELFSVFRDKAGNAEQGATVFDAGP